MEGHHTNERQAKGALIKVKMLVATAASSTAAPLQIVSHKTRAVAWPPSPRTAEGVSPRAPHSRAGKGAREGGASPRDAQFVRTDLGMDLHLLTPPHRQLWILHSTGSTSWGENLHFTSAKHFDISLDFQEPTFKVKTHERGTNLKK